MNCLVALNYKGYQELYPYENKRNAVDNFVIDEFFQLYTYQQVVIPKHTDITSPLNDYTFDWMQVSKSYRERKKWTCEKCGLNLQGDKGYLQTHHINGHKAYNDDHNLEALCIRCHSEQPGHGHMTQHKDYQKFVNKYPLQKHR